MRGTAFRILLTSLFLISSAVLINAQDPTPEPPTGAPAGPAGARPGGTPSTDPQPYDRVITKDAKTKEGIFKVHQIKDKYFYEIPKA